MSRPPGFAGAARPRRPAARTIVSLALIAATLTAYHGVLRADFVYDDDQYLLERAHLLDGLTLKNLGWAFTTFHASNWHPLAWVSHLIDLSLFGTEPAGHHATSLVLHLLNTVLLLRLLVRLTGALGRSAFVAWLFALHPLHVESVAWVAERKDVLSAAFFLLALEAYRRYVGRPGPARYLAVALLFCLGLLSKPMVVTLPFVLLLLDWWPLGRLGPGLPGNGAARGRGGRLLLEKVPLLLLSVASGLVTVAAQRSGRSLIDLEHLSLPARLVNATISYVRYLGETFLPAGLAVSYPLRSTGYPVWQFPAALLLLLTLTATALWSARRHPWLATGWLWYVVMLFPVIGLIQVGLQSHADRYTYLPLVGFLLALLWEAEARAGAWAVPRRTGAAAAAVALLALLLTLRQVGHWRDQRALFTHAREVTGENAFAAINIAVQARREGRLDEAIALYREALRVSPGFFEATYGLGNVLVLQGAVDAGIAHYRAALRIRPGVAEVWFNLGAAEAQQGRREEAVAAYRMALSLKPELVDGHMNLGNALSDLGRPQEALSAYAEALRLAPGRSDVYFNRGLALERTGRWQEATRDYREALRLSPDYASARQGLARLAVLGAANKGGGPP
jgi:tetratricopeptide (TPR) repeat protein